MFGSPSSILGNTFFFSSLWCPVLGAVCFWAKGDNCGKGKCVSHVFFYCEVDVQLYVLSIYFSFPWNVFSILEFFRTSVAFY